MAKRKMISKTHYHYSNPNLEMRINLSRFEKQYEDAQFVLDSVVMKDMTTYMPHVTGTQINKAKAMSASLAGSGTVVAAAPPEGRFLYEGKVMVDPLTGSPWARPGAKKVVTDRNLDYYKGNHPNVTDHWFDTAKKNHGESWVREVKKIAGGG